MQPFLSAAVAVSAASGPQRIAVVALLLGAGRSIRWSDRPFGAWLSLSQSVSLSPSHCHLYSACGLRAMSFQRS